MVALLSGGTLAPLAEPPKQGSSSSSSSSAAGGSACEEQLPVGLMSAPLAAAAAVGQGGASSSATSELRLPPHLLERLSGSGSAWKGSSSSSSSSSAPSSQQQQRQRQPRLQPHPRLLARSEAAGWRSFEALAESHLRAFISDCMHRPQQQQQQQPASRSPSPLAGGSSSSSSGGGGAESGYLSGSGSASDLESEGSSGSSCDEGDLLPWARHGLEEEEGGGGAQQQQQQQQQRGEEGGGALPEAEGGYTRAVARARHRLLYTELVVSPGGDSKAALVARSRGDRTTLALAYYRVVWNRFLSPASTRLEPHAFPWVVAGDYLLPPEK